MHCGSRAGTEPRSSRTPTKLPVMQMASDASSSWGCGAHSRARWFQVQWDVVTQVLPITVKELLPILLAGILWVRSWCSHRVICHCDNQPVVTCTPAQAGIDDAPARNLVFIEAYHCFQFVPRYIGTHANHIADNLLCDHVSSFLSKVPQASPHQTPVSRDLVNLLLDPQADRVRVCL